MHFSLHKNSYWDTAYVYICVPVVSVCIYGIYPCHDVEHNIFYSIKVNETAKKVMK